SLRASRPGAWRAAAIRRHTHTWRKSKRQKNVPARLLADARERTKLSRHSIHGPGTTSFYQTPHSDTAPAWSSECRFVCRDPGAAGLIPNRHPMMAQKRFFRTLQMEEEISKKLPKIWRSSNFPAKSTDSGREYFTGDIIKRSNYITQRSICGFL